jgi:hypothetical protein
MNRTVNGDDAAVFVLDPSEPLPRDDELDELEPQAAIAVALKAAITSTPSFRIFSSLLSNHRSAFGHA